MRKRLLSAAFMALTMMGASAQYFGNPFYIEGFDTQEAINGWTVENTLAPTAESLSWHLDTEAGYSGVVESSTGSLGFNIKEGDKIQSTITSPVIKTDGRESLVVGFSGYDLRYVYASRGIYIFFEVKATDQENWTEVYRTNNIGESLPVFGWNMNIAMLSAEFDGKDIQLRFRVEAPEYSASSDLFCAFDAVFVSQKPAVDPQTVGMSPYDFNGAFTNEESISITIKNAGRDVLENIPVNYQIEGGEVVSEVFAGPIARDSEATYTFEKKADLSAIGMTYNISVWTSVADDANNENNSFSSSVTNTLTTCPYKPTFWDGSRALEDYWTTIKDEITNRYWSVGRNPERTAGIWSINNSTLGDLNAKLISRPILFDSDKSYSLNFEIFMANNNLKGHIEVYYTTDATASTGLVEIYKNENLGTETTKCTASFSPETSAAYYVVFVAKTPQGSTCRMTLQNIAFTEVADYDLALLNIIAPEKEKYEYSNAEVVKVLFRNNGMQVAEGANAVLYVDGRQVATEPLETVNSGAEYEYTFTATADLTTGGETHDIKVAVSWDKDADYTNNELSMSTLSTVVYATYETDTYSDDFYNYWTLVDNNNDGLRLEVTDVYSNHRIEYAPTVEYPAATTDESIYSRPIKLYGGKQYRIEPRIIVEFDTVTYNVAIGLYKKNSEDAFELIKNIHQQDYSGWETYYYSFDVETDDTYYIGFNITNDAPTDYYFRLNEFKIVETSNHDIAIDKVFIPGTKLSAYNTLPLGVRVFNNGIENVDNITVQVSSPSMETYEETFTLPKALVSRDDTTLFLSKEITFANSEEVTIKTIVENDFVQDNNTVHYTIERVPSLNTPVSVPAMNNEGWLSIDRNFDGNTFSYYEWYNGFSSPYMTEDPDGDELISPSINMLKDKTYKVSFTVESSYFDRNDAIFDVYAINCATLEKHLITTYMCTNENYAYNGDIFVGYTTIPADGEYSIMVKMRPAAYSGNYDDFVIGGTLTVSESAVPDIELVAITTPAEDAIFGDAEIVTVSYKNAGANAFSCLPFTLTVGDKKYYTNVFETIAAGAEGTVTFTNVDLKEPTEYTLTVTAESYADATIENNTITKVIKSLPIIDMQLISLDTPKSGELSREEVVTVTLTNKGKGTLTNIPMSYVIKDINNADAVAMTANEIFAGPIAVNDTLQYSFTTTVNLSDETSYSIVVSIDIEGDTLDSDNSIATNVACTRKDMDAGVVAIVGPTDRLMTNEENLIIEVKNFGEGVLYDVPVTATVKQGESVIATLKELVPEVKAGETVKYTFTAAMDLSMGGVFEVTATTAIDRDINNENDLLTGEIYGYMIDCGIAEIISPESTVVAGEQAITVIIKNYGDIDVTDVPVRFMTGTMPQTGLYSGTISAGESVEYTFSTMYNFRENRNYVLTVYTEYEGDMNPENDTLTKEINTISGIDGTYSGKVTMYGSNGAIIVETDKAEGQVAIYDLNGRLIKHIGINNLKTVAYVEAGLYIVRVNTEEGVAIEKIAVK